MPEAKRKATDAIDLDSPVLSEPLRALAKRGVVKSYRKGTLLIEEGDQGDTIYIILSGRLRAYGTNTSGREITYGTYGPGEYLGEMSLDGGPRSASVASVEASTCAVITRQTLERYIGDNPSFAIELLGKVIRRARAATLSTKQLALNDVYGRLTHLFASLAKTGSDSTRWVPERLTHRDLSARLGCSREMVSRLMKDLESGGYLRTEPDGIKLLRGLPAKW